MPPRKRARAALLKIIVLDRTLGAVQEICEFETPSYTKRRRNKRLREPPGELPRESEAKLCTSPSSDGIDLLDCEFGQPDFFCEWDTEDASFFAFE